MNLPITLRICTSGLANITQRQHAVLSAAVKGHTLQWMADNAGLSGRSIRYHFNKGREHLGAKDRTQTLLFVTYLMQEGLW